MRPTQVIDETVGAGARSQSASEVCSGGVSTVMGSSDFVASLSTRHGRPAISEIAHCLEWQNLQ